MLEHNIAERVYNHHWKFDPIIRSLLDTDFYKLLMLQMIWKFYSDIDTKFELINRSKNILIAEEVEEAELRAQLDSARTLRFTKKEMIWLAGNKFYGRKDIFESDFLAWLENFQLPPYELNKQNGQYKLSFKAKWPYATMWEIPALAIINELRSRNAMQHMERFELDVLYSRAKSKLWSKIERLQKLSDLKITDFGTRRRHSFLWQNWCINALKEGLGDKFIGSSNVLLAMNNDLEACGTNAHELSMVAAAISNNEEGIIQAPYKIMENWQNCYNGNLLIVLPDVFGTEAFLHNAPDFVKNWRGFRPDSEPPIPAGERLLKWWRSKEQDPKEKLIIFSDALDTDNIINTYEYFHKKVQMSFGWGTNLTNDFMECNPNAKVQLTATSLICKVVEANGKPAVKLSDNLCKATGDAKEIERYINIFSKYKN